MNKVYCENCKHYSKDEYSKFGNHHAERCWTHPKHRETHISKATFNGWGNPSIRNKSNDCELFKQKFNWWRK